MIPSIGRIVHYKVGKSDAVTINQRRLEYPKQAQGNTVSAGDVFPMVITRIFDSNPTEESSVNGQLLLDGDDTHWLTSRQQGDSDTQWSEPPRV